jgi:hypothetical protein
MGEYCDIFELRWFLEFFGLFYRASAEDPKDKDCLLVNRLKVLCLSRSWVNHQGPLSTALSFCWFVGYLDYLWQFPIDFLVAY